MPELTVEQAAEYLRSVGIVLPSFMLELLVQRVNTMDPCLEGAGYDDATALLIKLYLIGLLGVVQGDRYVTSQTAPSGASQSFRYGTLTERYKASLSLLNGLDTSGCSGPLIPADPTAAHAGLWVAKGSCC